MKRYKKYETIHRLVYIAFFFYLLMIAVGDIDFGLERGAMPYHILIPFAVYFIVTIGMEILIRKEVKISKQLKNKNITKYTAIDQSELSGI